MAFITYPLNNVDYTAEDAELFHCTRTSGIWAEDSFSISVTGADNNVTVGTGIAWINNEEFSGKVTALKTAKVLDMGIADGVYPRIDVIAIQYSANNNATDVVIKKGTPSTNPVRPAIVRSGAVYELYLASIYRPAGATAITASNITDLRMDKTVCGLMADSVTRIDMTAIEAQVRSFINNLQNELDGVKNLSGLMFETEWTEGDVIPISKGGTGKNTAAGARNALGLGNTTGALPIANGGTGKTTAVEALASLGGNSIKKLWQNASPTSEFPAQTIDLDLSGYGYVEILFQFSTAFAANGILPSVKAPVGIRMYSNGLLAGKLTRRKVQVNTDGITFEDAGYINSYGASTVTDHNTVLIPYQIFGIKGVQ